MPMTKTVHLRCAISGGDPDGVPVVVVLVRYQCRGIAAKMKISTVMDIAAKDER